MPAWRPRRMRESSVELLNPAPPRTWFDAQRISWRVAPWLVVVLALAACQSQVGTSPTGPNGAGDAPAVADRGAPASQPASANAIAGVAAANPMAVDAGLEVLRAGGSARRRGRCAGDAGTRRAASSGLGGGGFLLHDASASRDHRVRRPRSGAAGSVTDVFSTEGTALVRRGRHQRSPACRVQSRCSAPCTRVRAAAVGDAVQARDPRAEQGSVPAAAGSRCGRPFPAAASARPGDLLAPRPAAGAGRGRLQSPPMHERCARGRRTPHAARAADRRRDRWTARARSTARHDDRRRPRGVSTARPRPALPAVSRLRHLRAATTVERYSAAAAARDPRAHGHCAARTRRPESVARVRRGEPAHVRGSRSLRRRPGLRQGPGRCDA